MRKEVSHSNGAGHFRIELEQKLEGVYVFVFERPDSKFPERDYLDDSWEAARARCLEDYQAPLNSWVRSTP